MESHSPGTAAYPPGRQASTSLSERRVKLSGSTRRGGAAPLSAHARRPFHYALRAKQRNPCNGANGRVNQTSFTR
jgi:hypothetical protein